jgi:hypothetical protein
MRPIDIEGHLFELLGKKEITNISVERVENLISVLFFDKINIEKLLMSDDDKGKKNSKGKGNGDIFGGFMEDKNGFVTGLRVLEGDEFLKATTGPMLTTSMSYDELQTLPRLVLLELIKESEKEIGKPEDFYKTFNMNMSIKPIKLLNSLQGIFELS